MRPMPTQPIRCHHSTAKPRWSRVIHRAACTAAVIALTLSGCKTITRAPVHAWRPPHIDGIDDQPMVFMGIDGPKEITEPLRQEFLEQNANGESSRVSRRGGGKLNLVSPNQLTLDSVASPIALVSMLDDSSNDMVIAAAAREQGIGYLLRGEVVQATGRDDPDQRLGMVWSVQDVNGVGGGGMPIYVDLESIPRDHPNLAMIPDPETRLRRALIAETFGVLRPTVGRETVVLAAPRLLPGSRDIRAANRHAEGGNWPAAETAWLAILDARPRQPAAWINAAIAAAARQDFTTAKARATEAIRLSGMSPANKRLAQQTLVWIEVRQRDYHHAFGLPDPPGGWQITSGSPRRGNQGSPSPPNGSTGASPSGVDAVP